MFRSLNQVVPKECAPQFEVGQTYLIYAESENEYIHPLACHFTKPITESAEELKQIKEMLGSKDK